MRRTTGIVLLGTVLCAPAAADELRIDRGWSADAVWDDGKAEVAHYDARRKVYGLDRTYEALLITVKEEFDAGAGVKADPPYAGRPLATVLKLNILGRIPTENYTYNYMTSVFARRDDPRALMKLSQSSQEWCGTTFKEVIGWDGPPRMLWHSYFDGQADGQTPLDLGPGSYLEEQLFVVLRAAALEPGRSVRLTLHDSLITNQAKKPGTRTVVVSISAEVPVTVPAGSFTAQRIALAPEQAGGPTLTFWREAAPRRALLRFQSDDGRSMELTEIGRRDYWSR